MIITRRTVVEKIGAYLKQNISLAELVNWSENVLMNGKISDKHSNEISEVIAHLGVADVKNFGLTWEDCQRLLQILHYQAKVELQLVA